MKKIKEKILPLTLSLVMLLAMLSTVTVGSLAAQSNITEASGWLESAYAEWTDIDGAEGYTAYVAKNGTDQWLKLDNQLIRQYKNYYRVDAVGLAAGSYRIKILPVFDGAEDEARSLVTEALTVLPHDRSGFAFVNGSSSGAYNDDGTLKSGAVVVYVTDKTKNSVTATIDGKSYTGLANILAGAVIKKTSTPICVRFIGNITDLGEGAAFEKGDLLLSEGRNITLEGIGEDTVINGFGIRIKRCSNIEIRNLATMNCDSNEGDNIGLQQDNDHIWVHNCDFFYGNAGSDSDQAKGDGALDTKTSSYVTHSYNHFWDSGKSNLQGMKEETTENYITYHHNWFDHSDSRHPRVRTCTVHVYNNFYDGVAKYGIGATTGSSIFSEANYFLNTKNPFLSSKQGTDALGEGTFSGENGGIIKSFADVFKNSSSPISYAKNNTSFDAYFASSRDEKLPSSVKTLSGGTSYNNFDTDSSLMYDYEVQSAEDAMESVKKYAGRVNGGDFKWSFGASENTNYAVISGLKSALTGYKTSVVAIGGINGELTGSDGNGSTGGSSGSGDSTGGDNETPDVGGGSEDLPRDTVVHNFTESGKTSDFFTINGNLSTSKGTVTYNGLTLKRCLKMESSTSITFTAPHDGSLTLVFVESTPNVKLDGKKLTGSDGIITVDVSSGSHTVSKADTMNLFYIVYTPVAEPEQPHVHSYEGSVTTEPTCTEAGVKTYTCSCGDSYTESIDAKGHSFLSGICEVCGAEDPNYVPPHEHSFVDGKCECGEEDPNYVPPHEHSFVDGWCECGEPAPECESCVDEDGDAICDVCGRSWLLPPHEHSFVDGKCECGEEDPNYVSPHEHSFVDGKCECGEEDPNYVPPHEHSFVDGKCECGAEDPNYVPPHEHSFVDGKCECGAEDPNYVPPHEHSFVDGKCECGEEDPDYVPEEPETPNEPEAPEEPEKLNFFQRIWRAILNFFARLFGGKRK